MLAHFISRCCDREYGEISMYRKMNLHEQKWIDKLLSVDFKGKEILITQISKSKIQYEQGYAFLFLKFKLESEVSKFPYKVRVPVEMRAFQTHTAPIIFLLHIIDGLVSELEIFPADSSRLDINNIELEKLEHEVDETVLL
jgi:hypothetical protein